MARTFEDGFYHVLYVVHQKKKEEILARLCPKADLPEYVRPDFIYSYVYMRHFIAYTYTYIYTHIHI